MNISRVLLFALLTGFLVWHTDTAVHADAPDPVLGASLFQTNCASCHNRNMRSDLTGPALGGTEERWADYPREDLYRWIRYSQQMIEGGHPKAVQLWNDWRPNVMQNFPNLSDHDIESMLLYINNMYTEGCAEPPCEVAQVAVTGFEDRQERLSPTMMAVMVGIMIILALILFRIANNLQYLNAIKEGRKAERKTLAQTLTNPALVSFVIFTLVVVLGYTTVNNAIAINRQQGYAPQQPIKFSHELHAGIHEIDCQFCHDGARRSKHAVIPAVSTCMSCHSAIREVERGNFREEMLSRVELSKIYASIGFNPIRGDYMDNYEDLDRDSVELVFTTWIEDYYIQRAGLNRNELVDTRAIQRLLADSAQGISRHVQEVMAFAQKPIEWVRIHNLPDHVYFNHAQHVTIGGLDCESCHGPVAEMEVLEQWAPLSMGWCVNCHRESEVKGFADNAYYHESYQQYHQDLQEGRVTRITVEGIGGLECQKCHY